MSVSLSVHIASRVTITHDVLHLTSILTASVIWGPQVNKFEQVSSLAHHISALVWEGFHVTIVHDVLDLTVQSRTLDMSPSLHWDLTVPLEIFLFE